MGYFIMKLLIRIKKLYLDFLLRNVKEDTYDSVHEAILNLLDTSSLENTNILVTSEWEFNCIFSNLKSYNEALLRVASNLQYNQMISPDWCRYEYRKVSFNRFFSENTYYIDKVKELNEFVRLVKLLKESYSKVKDLPIGIEGHNARQMARFITHINDLIVQITRASHQLPLHKGRSLL